MIDTSLLGIGSIATAGQTISAGALVNLYSFAGTLHAQIASAQNGGGSPPAGSYPLAAQGFAASSASTNQSFTVSFFGTFKYIDGNSEFNSGSIGAEVYLSDRGDGSPTLTPPSGGGELEQSVGYVVAFVSPNVVTINFASGFQDFTHISGVNPITKGGTGATTATQALINLVNVSATTGQPLVWSGSAWTPGSAAFQYIAAGTNTAALVVGSGGSFTFSGSGTINANQLTGDPVNTSGRVPGNALVWNGSAWAPSGAAMTSFTDITTGVNTTATMTVGTGASLTFSGTGVVNANQIIGTTISTITGTGALVLATAPTISGATLSGAITISGTATYTTANPTFFSAQGNGSKVQLSTGTTTTGDVVTYDANGNTVDSGTLLTSLAPLASPTFTGTASFANVSITGTTTFTTANPTFFSAQGNGSKVQLSTGGFTSGDVVTQDANGNTVDSTVALTTLTGKANLYDPTGAAPLAADNHIASGSGTFPGSGGNTVTVNLTAPRSSPAVQLTRCKSLSLQTQRLSYRYTIWVDTQTATSFVVNNTSNTDTSGFVWTAIGF